MSVFVCGGAAMQCPFGNAPSTLMVLPTNRVTAMMPYATTMDHVPFLNILQFGMCSSPANPAVIAATAAKLGVFSPSACIPTTPAPWTPGSSTVTVAGFPALNKDSQLTCLWGGVIQIKSPGQMTVMVP